MQVYEGLPYRGYYYPTTALPANITANPIIVLPFDFTHACCRYR